MPTVIDSLIVRLGLDSSAMDGKTPTSTKKLKELEKQGDKTSASVKTIGKASKETSAGLETLTANIGKLFAAIGSGLALKAFVQDQIEMNAQLGRLAQNLGLQVSTISQWGNAVEQMGGSAQGLQGTLDMLSKAQTELRLTGQSSLIPYFSALRVSMADVNGAARPINDILLDLSDRFSHMDRTTANNMGRMMGIDQGTLNLLLMGRKEVELQIARQKEYGETVKKFAPEAIKMQTALVDLKQKFTLLGLALLQQSAPALEKILFWLGGLADWAMQNKEFIADTLKVIAVGLTAVGVAALPIDGLVLVIAALAAGIILLWQDYQTWKRGGESLIDWGKWKPEIDAAIKGIDALRSGIDRLTDSYKSWYEKTTGHKFSVGTFVEDAAYAFGVPLSKSAMASPSSSAHAATGPRITSNVTAGAAWAEAQRVAKITGADPRLIFSDWAHETGNFTNRGAKELNNLAGVNVPGGKGQDYRTFKSLDEFGDYYAYLLRPGGRYSAATKATTAQEYAAALKAGGYYQDSEANYAAGMSRAMSGIPGASAPLAAAGAPGGASNSSTDQSVTNHIGQITIQTQATDAPGIMRGMDFLFTSQANSGVW